MKSFRPRFLAAAAFLSGASALHGQGTQQTFDANGSLTSTGGYSTATPVIVSQPVSQTVKTGAFASFGVVARGGAVTYAWKKNNAPIGGATRDTYSVASAAAGDEADYTVAVTNSSGSVTSSVARLSIDNDGDGLADSWELANLGSLSSDGSRDPDFDGRTNLEEFTDGTNPSNDQSAYGELKLLAVNGLITAAPASNTGRYPLGTKVTLTALPASGYQLNGWLEATPAVVPNQATVIIPSFEVKVTASFGPLAGAAGLAAAVDDSTGLVFTAGGAQSWVGESGGGARDGIDAARSGDIPRRSESWLQTTLTGPGTLTFWWRTSCDPADGVSLTANGQLLGMLGGEKAWQQVEMAVPAGSTTVRWTYARHDSGDAGPNRAWMDNLVWTPSGGGVPPLAEAIDLPGNVIATGGVRPWEALSRFQPMTVTGFDADVIAGSADNAGSGNNVWTAVTSTDLGTDLIPVLRETAGSPAGVYLPANGQLSDVEVLFQIPPDNGMNALRIGPLDSRTLTVSSPGPRRALRLLALSAGTASEMMCELEFDDGTRQSAAMLFRDWHEDLESSWPVSLFTRTTGAESPGYFLQTVQIPVLPENWSRNITALTFRPTGGSPEGVAAWIFAVSGAGVPAPANDDFAMSGRVGSDEDSWLNVALTGDQAVSFRWRHPLFSGTASLYFDGVERLDLVDGWQNGFIRPGPGTHVLGWLQQDSEYESLRVMVESVKAAAPGALPAALDGLTWTTGGSAPWAGYALPHISHDNTDTGVSGVISAGQESWMETQITGPGTLTWQWRMSAGAADELQLIVDGENVHSVRGEQDWQAALHTFGSGNHTIRWRYLRAVGTLPALQDAAFVDEVAFTSGTPPLELALDLAANLHVFSTGNATWLSQTATTHDATDAAACGAIGASAQSRLILRAAGPATLSYWRKISAATSHRLNTIIDGASVISVEGVSDWLLQTFSIGPGNHSVEWRYEKDDTAPAGSDTAWVDTVSWATSVSATLGSAVNNTGTWHTAGTLPWTVTNAADSQDGVSALRSGAIANNQTSSLYTWFQGPGELSFWWKVSSQLNADLLSLYIDGAQDSSISGTAGWLQAQRALSPGAHQIEWRYSKDGSSSIALDRGWVDQIIFTPAPVTLAAALDGPGLTWTTGGTGGWTGRMSPASPSHDGVDAAANGYTAAGQESWMETTVNGPGTFSFWSKVDGQPDADFLHFALDGVIRQSLSGDQDWRRTVCSLSPGAHVLRWTWRRGTDVPFGSDSAWVDEAAFVSSDPAGLLAGADLSTPPLVSSGTTAPWFLQSEETLDGIDALRSGITLENGQSFFNAVADGPALIGFRWKVSSEPQDRLSFSNDGNLEFEFGGQPEWSSHLTRVGNGRHLLQWQYLKTSFNPEGEDAAWVDGVEIATAGPLGPSLEGAGLTFTTGGNEPWAGYTMSGFSHDGVDLAASGQISEGQTSWLETTVTGPGTLSFWWLTSVAASSDAAVSIDGTTWLNGDSGGVYSGWTPVGIALNAGSHTIRWTYSKSLGFLTAFNGIRLDEVTWTAQASPPLFAAFDIPASPVIATGGGSWFRQTVVALDAGGALETGALNDGQTAELFAGITGPGTLVFQHHNAGFAAFCGVDDGFGPPLADGAGFWLPANHPVSSGLHRVKWTVSPGPDHPPDASFRLDKVNIGTPASVTLPVAVDAPSLTWSTSPSLPWTGQGGLFAVSADGVDCARAATDVPPGVTSWIETTLTGPGMLTFKWRADGGSTSFLIDGVEVIETSYGGLWFTENVRIGAGSHTIRWSQSENSPLFSAGLDQVIWRPGPRYAEWRAGYFTPAEISNDLISGLRADPDGDGLSNGVEALLGTHPRNPGGGGFSSSIQAVPAPAQWAFTFNIPTTPPVDLVPGIEICSDLQTEWQYVAGSLLGVWSALPQATVSTATGPPGFTAVTVKVPATGNRVFARLTVVQAGGDSSGTTSGGGWGSRAAGGGPGADGSDGFIGGGGGE